MHDTEFKIEMVDALKMSVTVMENEVGGYTVISCFRCFSLKTRLKLSRTASPGTKRVVNPATFSGPSGVADSTTMRSMGTIFGCGEILRVQFISCQKHGNVAFVDVVLEDHMFRVAR